LLKLRNEISGETADTIQKLFYNLNFAKQKRINSKKWDVIANGISELAQFDIKAHDKVITHINHSKKRGAKRNTILFSKTFFF
jgi:hypothetical protein